MTEADKGAIARKRCREIMTKSVRTATQDMTLRDVAAMMRDGDMGAVPVVADGKLIGIVTDRDIVVRAIAEGKDPKSTKLGEICSGDVVSVSPDQSVDEATELMRDKAVRRVPVIDKGRLIGIVSLGDLAKEKDEGKALAEISSAPPNN